MSVNRRNVLGIILARGGSKGVPNKNLRVLNGRPCIAWTVDHAVRSETLSHVLVSSDDVQILREASAGGVETDLRPPEEATDNATIDAAARGALDRWMSTSRVTPDAVAVLYGNVPVRPKDLTDRAVAMLLETSCDSVQSYAPVGKRHPWWTARVDASGRVRPWEGETLNNGVFRRQDLPPAFVPDGGALVVSLPALRLERAERDMGPHGFLGRDRRGILTEDGEVIDIDSEVDLLVAEAILSARSEGAGKPVRERAQRSEHPGVRVA